MRKLTSCITLSIFTFASVLLSPSVSVLSAPPIKIAAAGPYTGDLSTIGLDALNAIKMAIEETNKAGGIEGRKIELVLGDDGADPSKAILMAEKLGSDPSIIGVVGPMNSACVAASLPAYQAAGLPIITPSAGNAELSERGFSIFHRLCARDDSQSPAAAKFIADELRAKKVYIIDDKSTYGLSLADQVAKSLKTVGLKAVERGQITQDDKDLSPILTKIKGARPDVVFMGLSSPAQAASLVKQAAGLGIKTTFVGGNAQKEKDQYIKASSGLAEGSYVLSVGKDIHDIPQAKDFVLKFEKKYGSISAFSSQAYEAANVLLAAVRKAAASTKGNAIPREKVLKALKDTDGYKGIMGFPISFNRKGDIVGGRIYVLEVKGKGFKEVRSYASTTK